MTTLGLDFSTDHRGAAVWVAGDGSTAARTGTALQTSGRATPAFALIQAALDQAQATRHDVNRIVIGLGPGSATGIRTAIALARGWQLGAPLEIVGMSSLECLAGRLQSEGLRGRVHLAVDAQRREFHLAEFELSDDGIRETAPLRLISIAGLRSRIDAGARVFGPGLNAVLDRAHDAYPDALTLARLGALRSPVGPEVTLDAIHLRQPSYVKAPPPAPLPPPCSRSAR
jgi:tRNA threonylcarbamoyl adenosine modification protein YeaZ